MSRHLVDRHAATISLLGLIVFAEAVVTLLSGR